MKIHICSRMMCRLSALPLACCVAMLLVGCGDGEGEKKAETATQGEAAVLPDAAAAMSSDASDAEAPKVMDASVDEVIHSDESAPAAEPSVPEAPSPAEAETPSPVVEAPAPAEEPEPVVEVDFAPVSLRGKHLICSYVGAEMSYRSVEEGGDFSAYAPISDNGKGVFSTEVGDIPMNRELKEYSVRSADTAPTLVKYTRTGKNTAQVRIIALMIPDAEAALAIANVVSSVDSLTEEQIFEKIGQYALDASDTLHLTFTGENTATAEGEYCAGVIENKMRGMKVQLVDGAADAVAPESAESGANLSVEEEDPTRGCPDIAADDRSSLDPLISRMAALRCKHSDSALYQKRLLTLLPLIRNGADVNITLPETKGNTALHYACAIGSLNITTWLLEHGANPNAVTDKGATPLMCVGSDNRAAIVQALKSHGAAQGGGAPDVSGGNIVAPSELRGRTVVLSYTQSQYMYAEGGANISGWQSYQAALRNKNSCAEAFRMAGLNPKATRNLLPITSPGQGGKYVYSRCNANVGVIEVNSGGYDFSRTITIHFTSPTSGVATEELAAGDFSGTIRNIQVTIK